MNENIKTKKSLGQHWLYDKDSLNAMLEAANVGSTDTVLEVGPGLGTLTETLAQKANKVIAIEKDSDLISNLSDKFANAKNVEIINTDILTYNLGTIDKDYKVVANIPYYLTGKLIRNLIESTNPPVQMALLVQKEVADRIIAAPKDMSMLSFSVQYYFKASIERVVSKELFKPAPKVDSAIVGLTRLPKPMFEADINKLFRLVKFGFSQKRKTLRNSLSAGLKLEPVKIENIIVATGINPNCRAQELNFDQWQSLYNTFINQNIL